MMKFKQTLISLGIAAGFTLAAGNAQAGVLLHLFQWKFNDIANECEKVLGPKGYEGVQITPPAEHLNKPDVWWSVYQPVNLRNFHSYGGNEEELRSMITRCKSAGVKIYVDTVVNNWASYGGSGVGTGGSQWNSRNYPVFKDGDFHGACRVNNYSDRGNVQSCGLEGMPDLNTGSDYVQNEVATYMKTLMGWGVAGFRLDAAKHIAVSELHAILNKAGNPFAYVEVIGAQGEAVQPGEYMGMNRVTEFGYTKAITGNFNGQIKNLKTLGEGWGLISSDKAQVFVSNHDTERNSAGTQSLNYKSGAKYDLAQAFMLAWPYGWTQVYSGYQFNAHDDGAPQSQACSSGWNCEHRRPTVANMVLFRNVSEGQQVTNWWDNGNNQIAFGRGNKSFVVINNEGGSINQSFQTGLPAGEYCNILAGDAYCSGSYVTVDGAGKASFNVGGMKAAAIVVDCTKASTCGSEPGPDPDPEPLDKFKSMNLRGTFNGWKSTAMTVDAATRVWSAIVDFDGKSDIGGAPRFKFDVFGNWIENYGDNEGDGKADKSSLKDIAFTSVGKYKVELKESDLSYTLTPVMVNQAPKAVVAPATITVKVGEQVIFDASGSTDDVKVDTYSWSTGGAAKSEAVTFNNEGTEQVTLTVTDAEGLTSTATAIVIVNPVPDDGFISNFKQMSYRSSNNGWGTQAMELVADNTWQTTITLDGRKDQRFKLDVSNNMTEVFGDRNDDGKLDKSTVILLPNQGTYVLTVNDKTMTYTLAKQGTQFTSALSKLYFTGTPNKWGYTAMKLVADNTWYIRVKFDGRDKQRFRFDTTGKGTGLYGDKYADNVADKNGTPIQTAVKGYYIIKLNDKSMKYSLSQ